MAEIEQKSGSGLPENAFRELAEGETYQPVVPAGADVREVTPYSIGFGLVMALFWAVAATYLALKVGQGIETAIPIAILAIGYTTLFKVRGPLLQNVNVIVMGATSGIVVAGAVFTLPALYVLGIDHLTSPFQLFVVPFFGCVLGVLFLIPFRRYFVSDMHGKLPFPEGTATTEILMAGEKGGRQALVLVVAAALGGIYDFLAVAMAAWKEDFTTALVGFCDPMTHKVKAVFSMNTSAAIIGLGYIIGVRYAAIIFAGSMLSWFVLVPLMAWIGVPGQDGGTVSAAGLEAGDIFFDHVRFIGIGGIFAAGLIGILKLTPVIWSALTSGMADIFRSRRAGAPATTLRTDRDIRMSTVLGLMVLTIVLLWVYFRFSVLAGLPNATFVSLVALLITVVITFLFSSVSARAVAMIGMTPISGMTLMTLVVTCIVLIKAGVGGEEGMLAVLLVGGVVCTALSMTATLVTEFKIGYWLGATPRTIQWGNILGCAVAGVAVSLAIILFANAYGFAPGPDHPNPMPAPQPNAMAAVIESLMVSESAPWMLYGVGAVIAVIMEMLGISGLAFALGMYLPIELNSPILLGAIVAWFVKRGGGDEALGRKRNERGTLIASGFIAGGAVMGVAAAGFVFAENKWGLRLIPDLGNTGAAGNWLGLALALLLCGYIYWDARRGAPRRGD